MMKFFWVFLIGSGALAQSINDYRCLIVPALFSVQSSPGQFGLNQNAAAYFNQLGFEVYTDDVPLPSSIQPCDCLRMDVVGKNTFQKTRLRVVLRNCQNTVISESAEASSREKSNHLAFNRSLRQALGSIGAKGYKYSGKPTQDPVTSNPVKAADTNPVSVDESPEIEMLYAQPVGDGFQLVDTQPRVVLRIYRTSQPDVYSATDGATSGVLLKSGNHWVYEAIQDGKKTVRKFNIRF